jgi:predicted O-methyltransferase YrrM
MNLQEITAIRNKMNGEMALTDEVAQLLADLVGNSEIHIEIGAFWGGSAILAALAGARRVITIESREQFENVTTDAILDNFVRCGVAHRISMVKVRSNPCRCPRCYLTRLYRRGSHL